MYKYTRVVEVFVDEKEYIENYYERWDEEPPKTEKEIEEDIVSHFGEWTSNDFWESMHGFITRPYIKDYYEHAYAEKTN